MKERKLKRLTEKINVTVLAEAKKVLTDYQDTEGYANLDDALSSLLMEYPKLKARIKELEAGGQS